VGHFGDHSPNQRCLPRRCPTCTGIGAPFHRNTQGLHMRGGKHRRSLSRESHDHQLSADGRQIRGPRKGSTGSAVTWTWMFFQCQLIPCGIPPPDPMGCQHPADRAVGNPFLLSVLLHSQTFFVRGRPTRAGLRSVRPAEIRACLRAFRAVCCWLACFQRLR